MPSISESRKPLRAKTLSTEINGDKLKHKNDKRISVCSECRCGIFEGHEYEWTNRGLVHSKCLIEDL